MSIELVEVEIPFAGITAIEVEVVTGSLPGLGSPIISDTAPTTPVNGMRWLDTDGWIESVWSAAESAWIVPATNSIPSGAFLSPSGSPYLSPSGAYYLAAA